MGLRQIVKQFLYRLKPVRIHGFNNQVTVNAKFKHGFLEIRGNNNIVEIPNDVLLGNVEIYISGNNNHLIVDSKTRFHGPCKIALDGNATLIFGYDCGVRGVDFNIKNGTVKFGKKVMFSYGIKIRNHDSHKIFKIGDAEQINPPGNITVGNHCWIGMDATILKNVTIEDDSIIGLGSIVTKDCPNNSIMAGNPAKVVKTGIEWDY